jgi:S1-C subfamily serine protease
MRKLIPFLFGVVLGVCGFSAVWGVLSVTADDAPPSQGATASQSQPRTGEAQTDVAEPAAQPIDSVVNNGELELTPDERVNVAVYEQVNRSVVNVISRSVRFDFFFEVPEEGAGSGSILDKQGHVLTNLHVVQGAQELAVTLFNSKTYPARPVGVDANSDIALLKIDAPPEELFPVTMGDSSKLKVGLRVFAIGNPFGLERTLTVGIVSSLNRSLMSQNQRLIKDIIQTDAAINPGNSGGPLLDSRARLVGMNTAIVSRVGQSSGVGFAVPVNTIKRIIPQLIERGRVIRADLGIAQVTNVEGGLLIAQLIPGGPAEKAGLRGPQVIVQRQGFYELRQIDRSKADIIVGVDDQPVASWDDLLSYVESKKPGDVVEVVVIRQGRPMKVSVTLEESPQ